MTDNSTWRNASPDESVSVAVLIEWLADLRAQVRTRETAQSVDAERQVEIYAEQLILARYRPELIQKVLKRWPDLSQWWPTWAELRSELNIARSADRRALPPANGPWQSIKSQSAKEWSERLVKSYEEQHRGLSLAVRLELERQAMNMVRDNGAGTFGVHPHPIWTAQDCLRRTRYA